MTYDIYICYDDHDLSIAKEILHIFEENQIKCFFKEYNNDNIDINDLDYKISLSKVFILVLSNHANKSSYVKNEVNIAFSMEIPIITFKIDDCDLEYYFEFFISLSLSIDAYPNYKNELEYLLDISSKLLDISSNTSKQSKSIFSKLRKKKSNSTVVTSKPITPKSINSTGFNHDVYIIYSTKEQDVAYDICNFLEDNYIKCWIAPRDFKQGEDIYIELVRAIKNTKMVLWIFSKNSQQSIYSRNELRIAINREKSIISFIVDETTPKSDDYYSKIQNWIPVDYFEKRNYEILSDKISDIVSGISMLVPGEGRLPFPAYRGKDEYIFVSYAHKDANIVFAEVRRFQNLGYNIWYDEGIGAGNEWLKDIVAHLKNCKLFVVFVTNNSMASVNVQKEIKYAVRHDKNIIPIYLEDFDSIEMEDDIDFELSVVPDILKTTLSEEEYLSEAIKLFTKYDF